MNVNDKMISVYSFNVYLFCYCLHYLFSMRKYKNQLECQGTEKKAFTRDNEIMNCNKLIFFNIRNLPRRSCIPFS